jgi:hypothetical protein
VTSLTLPGPSRTITVEPVEEPATPAPAREPEPATEPEPKRPARKPRKPARKPVRT